MALDKLTIIDGGGLSTTSDYRVGVITATKFVGPVEGSITATDATFSGNVSIAGTLTYEDVTNVDSVGIITARNGIKVSTGTATTALVVDGDARVTGILTVGTSSLKLDGPNNLVNVGTALTLGHTQGVQFHTQNLHSAGFEVNQINASGIITASNVGIAESIFHVGDTDTTIGFPATNHIKIHTGGVERLLINNSYNWLKNTTYVNTTISADTPTFTVRNNTQSYHTIWSSHNTNARSTIFQWNDNGNSGTAGNLIFRSLNSGYEEHARFTGAGNFNLLKDLDVDGHTNLDNVSIAGVTTMGQTKIFTTGGTTLLLQDSDSTNPADRSGIAFVDQNNTQTAFIGKESATDAVLTINNTNTINPIRLKVNNTTRLEVGNAGVYATGSLSATGTLTAGGTLYIPDEIQHSGDADTKIRFPTTDKCRIELGGVTSAFSGLKSTSGAPHAKWGINVATPQAALHIDEAYNHQGVLRVTNGNQGAGYYHQLEMSGTQNIFALWRHFDGSNFYNSHAHGSTGHIWYINGSEKLRVHSNGNVGIATNNPGGTLDVLTSMGRIKFNNSGSIGSKIDFANADGTVRSSIHNYGGSNEILALNTSGTINFNVANSTKMKLASNGIVGIGSDNPNRPLSIGAGDGTVALHGGNAGIYIGTHPTGGFQNNCAIARAGANNYHITGSSVGDLCIAGESTKDIIIGTSVNAGAMNERMRFHHDGLVDITGTGTGLAFNVGGGYIRSVGGQPSVVAHKSSSTFCHIGVEGNSNARAFLAYTNDKDFIIGRRSSYTGDNTGYSGADITIDKTNHAVVLSYNGGSRLNTTNSGVNITGTLECDGVTSSGGLTTTGGYVNLQGSTTTKILLQGADSQLIRYRNAASTYVASITSIGNGDTFQLLNEKQSQYLNIETGGVRIGGRLTLPTTDTGITFGPGTASSDYGHIEWKGGDNAGYLRISVDDDSDAALPAEYIEFGDYQSGNRGGTFTQQVKIARNQFLVRTGGTSGASDRFNINESGNVNIYGHLVIGAGINITGNNQTSGITKSGTGFQFGPNNEHYLYQSATNEISLRISSDGPYAVFEDYSGDVMMGSNSGDLRLAASGNSKVIVTNSNVQIAGDLYMSGELNLTHDGNKNRFIDCSMDDGESLHLRSTQGGDTAHETMATFTRNGACSFHFDGSSDFKFQTASHGMNVHGDIHLGGSATTTNQNRKIYWTGFDKENTNDFTDYAEIRHAQSVHGITGSVLEIISQNDASDGIALNASNGYGQIALNGKIRGNIEMHDYGGRIRPSYGTGDKGIFWQPDPAGGSGDYAHIQYYTDGSGEDTRLRIQIANDSADDLRLEGPAIRAEGSFSSTNKHFRIPHVLSGLTTTTDLIHSVVEGPQADNLYRGRTTLVAGISTVNIDTTNNMTDGTFVNLNRDVQCFTTNETGWTAIKGSVTGNLLTIVAQDNTCTDTISWMVIGERWDLAMYDPYNPMTDANGKAKTEIPNDSYNKGGDYEQDYISQNRLRVGISTFFRPSIENKEVE